MTFTVNDLCERYGVTEHTILAWVRNGELKALNVGRTPGARKPRWRFTEAAVEAFEALRSSEAPAPPPVRRRRKSSAAEVTFYK